MKSTICAALLCSLVAGYAQAAGPVDPDWPCIQRRQPSLSVGQVWSGPATDDIDPEVAQSPDVRHLGQILALRRTTMEEAEALIADFASDHDQVALTALFLESFNHIQKQRDAIMAGITRYAHKQAQLDARIDDLRHEFTALTKAEPQDFDRIDRTEEQIEWSTRIFQDRQQSLTYVCETPTILEQRAFALGRAIAAHLPR